MNDTQTPDRHQSSSDNFGPRGDEAESTTGMGKFGMALFLASLSVLFAASLIGYLVVRARADAWPPPEAPRLPVGMWISTILILASSVTIHGALSSVKRNRLGVAMGLLMVTALLGVCFLVSQVANWAWIISITSQVQTGLYLFTFYLLTGLHAAHVIGGLILLAVVTARAFHGRYSSSFHPGVTYATMYWHFLDIVWLVMFAAMFLV
jgi:cytochrome c oxidase subunit 3